MVEAILAIVLALIPIIWTLYKRHWGKKAAEKKRREAEDTHALEEREKAQQRAADEAEAHDLQQEAEEGWRAMKGEQVPSTLVVHCSATKNGQPVTARAIDKWHRERKPPFKQIGYHKVIQVNGFLEDSKNSPCRPETMVGAGVKGANRGAIHICMIGDDGFCQNQFDTLKALVLELKQKYRLKQADLRAHYEFDSAKEQGKTCPNMQIGLLRQWIFEDSKEAIKGYIL